MEGEKGSGGREELQEKTRGGVKKKKLLNFEGQSGRGDR